jgi:hypothetical protein
MRQQRLADLPFRDQCAAMALGDGDEASGHVVAKKRDACGMAAVAHRQGAAGAGVIFRASEHALRAKGNVQQIAAVPWECVGWSGIDFAAADHRRIGDFDAAVTGGAELEVRGHVFADQFDLGDRRSAARHREHAAGGGRCGAVGGVDLERRKRDRDQVDELGVVGMADAAEAGDCARIGGRLARCILNDEPAGPIGPEDDVLAAARFDVDDSVADRDDAAADHCGAGNVEQAAEAACDQHARIDEGAAQQRSAATLRRDERTRAQRFVAQHQRAAACGLDQRGRAERSSAQR